MTVADGGCLSNNVGTSECVSVKVRGEQVTLLGHLCQELPK